MGDPDILLTNDDGIDEPGLRALYDALSSVGSVTVVAPESNQSAIGRSLSYGRMGGDGESRNPGLDFEAMEFSSHLPHAENDIGYAVAGTPCDCVILGTYAFESRPDVVVSGCNPGANLGAYVLGRSGTASAAMEAAFLGVPAVAVSMDRLGYDGELTYESFEDACEFAADLLAYAVETDVFEEADYLNVNAPTPDTPYDAVEVTRPTPVYEMDASFDGERFRLTNRLWEQMAEGDLPDPPGTDRRAIEAGRISVSPLAAPLDPVESEALSAFAAGFQG